MENEEFPYSIFHFQLFIFHFSKEDFMKNSVLYALWGGLYILCAGLGFIPEPAGAGSMVMTLLALAFFVPPAVLLYRGHRDGDRKPLCLIRNLSAVSLGMTFLVLILNFLSIAGSETMGNILYYLLILVSSPMVCSQQWFLSMFLWACLLMGSLSILKARKKKQK